MKRSTPAVRRTIRRLGASGALGAMFIGSCAPAQCTPAPPPTTSPPTTSAPTTSPPATGGIKLLAKPVEPPCKYYANSFGAPRSGGRTHQGVDIMAPEGNDVYAVVAGVVTKTYSADTSLLAGNGLLYTEPDGTYFFYGHMTALAPGIAVGTKVVPGQLVGWVGHTGNTTVNHLHFEVHPQGGAAIDPYPILQRDGAC